MSTENNINPFGYDTRNVETPGYFQPGHQLPVSPETQEQISKDQDIRGLILDVQCHSRGLAELFDRLNKLEKKPDQSGRITYLEKENQRLEYERDAYHAKVLALIDYIAGNRDE